MVRALKRHCDLACESGFVDIGAGLGRPLVHVMVMPGVKRLWGIEMDSIKVQKALAFLRQMQQKLCMEGILHEDNLDAPKFTHSAVEKVVTLSDFTV